MGNPWEHHDEDMAPGRRIRNSRGLPRTPVGSPAIYRGQSFAQPRGRHNPPYHLPPFNLNSRARYQDEGEDDDEDDDEEDEEDEDWQEDDDYYSSDGFYDADEFSLGGRSYERRRPRFDHHSRMHQVHHHGREPHGRYRVNHHPPRDPYGTQPAGYYNSRVPGRYPRDDHRTGMHHDDLRSRASSEDSW
ncbi:hypothetical protein G7Y79_00038g074420 [Physcia stellaris]|nr:hypothetical protein G7Y79_00038g074420 [Physcia stellaris]